MASKRPANARLIGMAVLNRIDPKRNYAGPILNKELARLSQASEKQRATDLVYGTIRNRQAIDTVIASFANCPASRISAKVINIIRIGVYELVWCPQTSDYAIVNEAVENTKTVAGRKQTDFVNAVLRQIARHIKNRQISLSKGHPQKVLSQTALNGCEFDICFLPDAQTQPADYFSTAFSLPKWLIKDWLAEFGLSDTGKICFASNRKPCIYIRPNRLKTTTAQLTEEFSRQGIDFETVSNSMVKIKSPKAITQLPGFTEGLFSVQDLTASQAARSIQPQPGWAILDLCAAPGSKTIQLAELTDDKARIVATDINKQRLEKVKENINRLQLSSISVVDYDQLEKIYAEVGPFDCVLVDAPCSNTGVLARRPEARHRITPKAVAELAKIQYKLLATAAGMIKPNGKICYSTCSIQSPENTQQTKQFLEENPNFTLESELLTLPSADRVDCDGGYVAIIAGK